MPDDNLLTFANAIQDSEQHEGARRVLLGNGFSIDWRPEAFHYESLLADAKFDDLSAPKDRLFGELGTSDFETLIESLDTAANLIELYSVTDVDLVGSLRHDAQVIRDGLAEVIARRHPGTAQEMTEAEVERAREFLSWFPRIFTLNYDLVLYWVVNRSQGGSHVVAMRDGFERPTADGPNELIWKSKPTQGSQQIFYLHGALHYFVEKGGKLHKLRYGQSAPLVDQIRQRIESGDYPRLVTEGKTEQKLASIARSSYLRECRRAFADSSGSLFMHGLSFSRNDDHIFDLLESKDSNVEALYVSVFGDPTSYSNDELMRRARLIRRRRSQNSGRKLQVKFYSAETAHVWR